MMDRKVMMDRGRQDSVSAVQEDEENGGKESKGYKLKRCANLSSCAPQVSWSGHVQAPQAGVQNGSLRRTILRVIAVSGF